MGDGDPRAPLLPALVDPVGQPEGGAQVRDVASRGEPALLDRAADGQQGHLERRTVRQVPEEVDEAPALGPGLGVRLQEDDGEYSAL